MLRRFFRRRSSQPPVATEQASSPWADGMLRALAREGQTDSTVVQVDPAASEARLQAALAGLDAVMSSTALASASAIAATQIGGQP